MCRRLAEFVLYDNLIKLKEVLLPLVDIVVTVFDGTGGISGGGDGGRDGDDDGGRAGDDRGNPDGGDHGARGGGGACCSDALAIFIVRGLMTKIIYITQQITMSGWITIIQ